jgi:hypothetical protein
MTENAKKAMRLNRTVERGYKYCSICVHKKSYSDYQKDNRATTKCKSECLKCREEYLSNPENREKKNLSNQKYRKKQTETNYESYREAENNRKKNWVEKNKSNKLMKNISNHIRRGLKKMGFTKKRNSKYAFLSYSKLELINHLEAQWEPWMSWDNYGPYRKDRRTWQIDHIIPQSKLKYSSMEDEEFKKCWSLDNLRPLEAMKNIKKGCINTALETTNEA